MPVEQAERATDVGSPVRAVRSGGGRIYRGLVEADSDAYLPNLAASLNNLSNRLENWATGRLHRRADRTLRPSGRVSGRALCRTGTDG
jgi:hypothetical protein